MKYIRLTLINIVAIGILHLGGFLFSILTDGVYEGIAYLLVLITPITLFIGNYLLKEKLQPESQSNLIFILIGSIGSLFLHFLFSNVQFENGLPYDPSRDNMSTALVLFLYKAVFVQCFIGAVLYEWRLYKKKNSNT